MDSKMEQKVRATDRFTGRLFQFVPAMFVLTAVSDLSKGKYLAAVLQIGVAIGLFALGTMTRRWGCRSVGSGEGPARDSDTVSVRHKDT